jgi:hypothetical protein
VAHRACLILLGLVVKGGRSRDIRILRQRVALKAQQIRLRPLEQPRICGSMWGMTGNATLSLNRLMLKDKRPRLVSVTSEAHLVLGSGGAQLLGEKSTMLIVTVGALYQPLFNTVTEGPIEVLLNIGMTAVAQFRLFAYQQKLFFLGVVRRVAGYTAHVIGVVLRSVEVRVLFAVLMASQAALAYVFSFRSLEDEYLGFVAAGFDVSLAGTVASFAALPLRSALRQCGLEVRSGFKIFENIFVAGLACLGPNVISRSCCQTSGRADQNCKPETQQDPRAPCPYAH